MKQLIAKELLFFFIAVLVAIPMAFAFVYAFHLEPQQKQAQQDVLVLEMDLLLIGGVLGLVGMYIMRLAMWAVRQVFSS